MGAIRDFLASMALVKFPDNNVKRITAKDMRDYQDVVASQIDATASLVEEVSEDLNYRVEILSTNGTQFRNDIIDTTFIARVYKGAEDITDSANIVFKWTRKSDNPDSDTLWNLEHQFFNSSILNIDSDDVDNKAVFNCQAIIN